MAANHRFLHACRRQPVDATPVWLMRQAGRYMAEYRELRARHTLLEMIKTPELAAEVTFQPLRAFDLDAGIIFADILTLPEAMGMQLEFIKGEGPVFHNPIRTSADIAQLHRIDPDEALGFTMEAIRIVCRELNGDLPLIGFAGAPFTLACYMIEGGSSRHFIQTKMMMYRSPAEWHALMAKLADVTGRYLAAQVRAGAAALQLFDSWAGLLGPADYAEYVLPHTRRVFEIAREASADIPLIHFGTDTAALLPHIASSGATVIGVDWRIDLQEARSVVGPDIALQGNLDPVVLFAEPSTIRQAAKRICDAHAGTTGHIFNLGHGILPETPPENVAELVDFVHDYTRTTA